MKDQYYVCEKCAPKNHMGAYTRIPTRCELCGKLVSDPWIIAADKLKECRGYDASKVNE